MKTTPRSKAAMVDLSDVEPNEADNVHAPGHIENLPRRSSLGTAPGQAMQNMVLREKIAEWEGALPVRRIDPTTIVRSKWANRHEESFSDAEFALLKADIESAEGNVQPIKVRRIAVEGEKYEVVFGHRRHQACLELGIPVLAMISEVSDQDLFVEMDRENRQRKDLRPYEQGLMYKRALEEGLFPSARRLAESLSVDLTNLGKALALARLPTKILEAFVSPLDLQYRWAADLNKAFEKNPDLVIATANQIKGQSPRLAAKDVFEKLVAGGGTVLLPTDQNNITVKGSSGQAGSLRVDAKKRSIHIDLKNIDANRFDELKNLISDFIGR